MTALSGVVAPERFAAEQLLEQARFLDEMALFVARTAQPCFVDNARGRVSGYRHAARSCRRRAASIDRSISPFEVTGTVA